MKNSHSHGHSDLPFRLLSITLDQLLPEKARGRSTACDSAPAKIGPESVWDAGSSCIARSSEA